MRNNFNVILLFLFVLNINAQVTKIAGSWLLTKVEVNNEIQKPFAIIDFHADGKVTTMGIEVGTWELKNNTIHMSSTMDKDFNGISTIVKLTDKELVLNKDNAKLFYTKIAVDKIEATNKASGLVGTWKFKESHTTSFLQLKEPDIFTLFTIEDQGIESTSKGQWIYDAENKSILFIGFAYEIRGNNKILEHTDSTFIFKHNDDFIFKGVKEKVLSEIERLTFEYEDFPEDDDNQQLSPWNVFYEMLDFLEGLQSVTYKEATLEEEVNQFTYETIVSKFDVIDEKVICTDYRVSNEGEEKISEVNSENIFGNPSFFPKEVPFPYRKSGEEIITTPAGTFECVIIEGMDGETKLKYWMIKNKPGIYAKIIKEEVDVFDKLSYTIYELQKIQTK